MGGISKISELEKQIEIAVKEINYADIPGIYCSGCQCKECDQYFLAMKRAREYLNKYNKQVKK